MIPQPVVEVCRHDVDKSVEVRGIEVISPLLGGNELLYAPDLGIVLVVGGMFKMRRQISRLYYFCNE